MSDTIFINGLVMHAHHGVMKHETKVGQRFVIDMLLSIDLKNASRSDKLADTIDYAAIVDVASRTFTGAISGWSRPRAARSPTRC